MKKIIGLNAIGINTSACILVDGKIKAAIEEERLSRNKRTRLFPEKSIQYCLDFCKFKIEDIDAIAISWNPLINLEKFDKFQSKNLSYLPNILHSALNHIIRNKSINDTYFEQNLKIKNKDIKIFFIKHHLCHASMSYYSNFSTAGVFTNDGFGEKETSTLSILNNSKLKKLESNFFPHSLGSFYSTFTEYCGFKPQSEEWKLMGASSYHNSDKIYRMVKNLIELKPNGKFELDLNFFNHYQFHRPKYFNQKLIEYLQIDPRENDKSDMQKKYFYIANAAQKVFEDVYFHQINYLSKVTKTPNLVVSGGCAMNCVANGKIHKRTSFKNIFVSPVPDDSGACLGAVAYLQKNIFKNKKNINVKNFYLGPSFTNKEIEKKLRKYQIKYTFIKNIEKYVAKEISSGKVVAWFQNRLEFGDRALGNRSILGDPRNKKIKDLINSKIKYREKFRPFAPAILKEFIGSYFEEKKESKYMELALKFKKKVTSKVPGVVHVDKTGRLQSVDKNYNPKFYNLINEFYKLTNIPIILNTSFNIQGEPIVCSIEDAIKNFYLSGLDKMYIGDFEISK